LKHTKEHGIAVVAVGNSLRGDDGVAAAVCGSLPEYLLDRICYFNAESRVGEIPSFLANHQKAIIIDAMNSGGTPGEMQIVQIDLNNVRPEVHVNNAHGLSWLDELLVARRTVKLPELITFCGIEVVSTAWKCGLSTPVRRKLRDLSGALTKMIWASLEEEQCTKQPLHP
jgi:hydrogenase maturation protease